MFIYASVALRVKLDRIHSEIVETRRRMRKIESLLDIAVFTKKEHTYQTRNEASTKSDETAMDNSEEVSVTSNFHADDNNTIARPYILYDVVFYFAFITVGIVGGLILRNGLVMTTSTQIYSILVPFLPISCSIAFIVLLRGEPLTIAILRALVFLLFCLALRSITFHNDTALEPVDKSLFSLLIACACSLIGKVYLNETTLY